MLKSILGAFIGKNFPYQGSLSTILAAILPHLYESIQNNYGATQKTIWLERTYWLKDDYSAYRYQDSLCWEEVSA